ncbi:HDOD domain-containing protein [Gemmatimonas sp.]|jgi:EAL and modified HD-GYP domain-containing signal transduction protein|uniref:EAL and HDOD domain-containing protein n=1 Tax=Gemmatimonas sp. TaxID=1962908 RepID=UPI0022C9B1F3|nr:HDOD domain-containing protein [Gemmatimonas sp.]MCZ8203800.1 HDOD domain-containing protein [Gemmatimonas sp.]
MSDFALVRQPVFGGTGSLLGYDIRFHETEGAGSFAQSFLNGTFDLVRNRLPAFVSATRDQLLGDAFLVAEPGSVIVMLPAWLTPDTEVNEALERLRAAGAQLAIDEVGAEPVPAEAFLPLVQWVRVDSRSGDPATVNAICDRLTAQGSSLRLVAAHVEELDQYEATLERGFDGFQGTFFSRPEPLPTADMPQSTVAAMRLMGLARDQTVSDRQLEDVIATDPVLTFQLIRLVNSAALGGRGVASIGQALRLTGRSAFLRWLAVAVAAARKCTSGVDQELVRQAVERGRLCEQLVGSRRDAGTLFLVGLFSLLDAVFRMPLADILERVALSAEANEALIDRTGPYADAINFAESYELGLFENASEIAREMGVDPAKVGEFYTNAITWAAQALGASLESQAAAPVKKAS